MLELILMVALTPVNAPAIAQVQTCVWPHVCNSQPVAQVQPCVWPNICKDASAVPAVAQVQTCVWPHVCKDGGVHACDFPNKCS